ncbi:MAG: glycosyltransferase family 2 protein [Ginsengibacter sp.]
MIISILIPIHNRIKITQDGMESLLSVLSNYQTNGRGHLVFHIIVIDDGSTDGSSKWISENYPDIIILKGDGNLWWSGAMNEGTRYAINTLKSDFVLLWNDDIVASDDYFLNLEKLIDKDDLRSKIVGSKIFFHNDQSRLISTGGIFNKFTGKMDMDRRLLKDTENYKETDWLAGMGTLIPASVFQIQNIWWDNEKFPQYYGDADFCLECKKQGIKILLSPKLIIYNKTEYTGLTHGKTLKEFYLSLTSLRSNYNFVNTFSFYSRHGTPFAYFGLVKRYLYYFLVFLLKR